MKKLLEYNVGELVEIELITWAYVTEFGHDQALGRIDKGDVVTLVTPPSYIFRWNRKPGEKPVVGRWRAFTKHGIAYIDIGSEDE